MNDLAGFRLCKLSDDELLKRVDLGCDKMYETGKIPDRNIPAKPERDFDLLLGELLIRFDELNKIDQAQKDQIKLLFTSLELLWKDLSSFYKNNNENPWFNKMKIIIEPALKAYKDDK